MQKNLQIPKPVKMMNSTKTNPHTVSKYRAAANSMTRQYFEHIKSNITFGNLYGDYIISNKNSTDNSRI